VVQALGVATAGVKSEDQGIAAGLFNMSQQLGGALGLAAIATVAAAAGASHVGAHLAAEAHGFRYAFGVAACLGYAGAMIALVALRAPDRAPPETIAVAVHPGRESPT
jgi:MFS family permease